MKKARVGPPRNKDWLSGFCSKTIVFRGADTRIGSLFLWAGSSIGRALDLQSGRLGSNPTVSIPHRHTSCE